MLQQKNSLFGKVSYILCHLHRYHQSTWTRSSAIAEGPRDALSVEILSAAAQLHEKSHFRMVAIGAWPW